MYFVSIILSYKRVMYAKTVVDISSPVRSVDLCTRDLQWSIL